MTNDEFMELAKVRSYSARSVVAGLAVAAFTDWKVTVMTAMPIDRTHDTANTHHGISMR
jgi:hypothetical protein